MNNYLTCVLDIAELMLVSGAEVHRVEESVSRMCRSFGALRTDVFIITSSMVTTVHLENNETLTQTRRITKISTNVENIHRLNALSRRICAEKLSLDEIYKELELIKEGKPYPFWLELICYSVIAGAFTLFFGGTLIQALVSLVIGGLVRVAVFFFDRSVKNPIFTKFLSSLFLTFLALIAIKLSIITDIDKVVIGNIMTLIPGIGLTNAFRDLFTGDSIAGLLRTIEAILTALAIAGGYLVACALWGLL